MFEWFDREDLPARFRGAAMFPLTAVVIEQIFFTIDPLTDGLPIWIFRTVQVVLFVAGVDGLVQALRLAFVNRSALDVVAILWFVAAIGMSLFAVTQFIALTFPGRIF